MKLFKKDFAIFLEKLKFKKWKDFKGPKLYLLMTINPIVYFHFCANLKISIFKENSMILPVKIQLKKQM